jgi:two-component system CheB/CheR fusion protein
MKKDAKMDKNEIKLNGEGKPIENGESFGDNIAFPIVAIGASAGGLEAITLLLENLSPDTGMAFIYVQHLSPEHKSLLTPILSKVTKMKVQDAEDMDKMMPNNVYVIPYDSEIKVTDGHIKLVPRPKNRKSNMSIDLLFSSLAETHKENVIGIVLSGSANDGTQGLKEIKQAGGITFAQDGSAKFSSMPKSAISVGVVDFIRSPEEIGQELTWMGKHPLVRRDTTLITPEDAIENSDPHLKVILQLLLKKKNVDFSHYKMTTIKRRMLRRMLIHKIKNIKQYVVLLEQQEAELDLLYHDLLINVTDFFRDPEAFVFLENTVLPKLLTGKVQGETLRIWVAACATGEEVYSIAILLFELMEKSSINIPFQIFASDLSSGAIGKARLGEYTVLQVSHVSPKRLQHFFVKSKDRYRVNKNLRDACVFAQHNILNDPPFSRMDLISCRNLLIYLDMPAQRKAMSTFHYSLNDGGSLFLGKSETIGTSTQLFIPLNKKYKVYARKKNVDAHRMHDLIPRYPRAKLTNKSGISTISPPKLSVTSNGNIGSIFDEVLLSKYVPASVIINHDLEILQFRGDTTQYLQNQQGKASFNILKMAQFEITFELRNAIHSAIKAKQTVLKTGIEMAFSHDSKSIQFVNIEVSPLVMDGDDPLLLIVFTGHTQLKPDELIMIGGNNEIVAKNRRIKKLEEEIAATRINLKAILHDQEEANEELQSANEEIISSNEELQSLNEELETSKEEIESSNEELITSNQELQARIQQVEELYTYYESILSTLHEPMLILDKNLRIQSANKSFCKVFQEVEEEIIGTSLYKLGNDQWNIPKLRELIEDIVPKNVSFYDFEVEQVFPLIGLKTMLLNAHRIDLQNQELIVLSISDITEIKRLSIELEVKEKKVFEASEKRHNLMLMDSPFAIGVLKGKDMVIELANNSIKELWGKGNDIEGKKLLDVLPEIKGGPMPILIDEVFTTGIPFHGYEVLVPLYRNGKLEDAYFNFVYQPYLEADRTILGITVISYEVTEHVIAKMELMKAKGKAEKETKIAIDAVKSKQQFLSNMSHEIRTPMNAIIGFTNVLLKTNLDPTQKGYIQAVKASGDALIVIINDILDLAKVNSGKMTFDQVSFDLDISISSMLQLFDLKIKEKNLELIKNFGLNIPNLLIGDPMRLRQIILNLLSNAIKFTDVGTITFDIKLIQEDEDLATIEFKIIDTGIGIPENKLEYIFNDFEQAYLETSSTYGGTGLGLAIVKQLVELQGGTIYVESKKGNGSTFGFTMSFKKDKAETKYGNDLQPIKKVGIEKAVLGNMKVLVVEDMAMNQLLIKIILSDLGFDIEIANNGKIALEKLQKDNFDIILMDLQMPEMNGFEATNYIRTQLNSNIPIIALTADVTSVDLETCKSVGMNDYISKPIDEKLLYAKIMEQLKV